MKKNGFTLLELLTVIVIMGIVTTSSLIMFGNVDEDTQKEDRANVYKSIQRSAMLYLDLNDDWLGQFKDKKELFIEISELMNTNYVGTSLEDPVTKEEIPGNYLIKLFVAKDKYGNDYMKSCVLDKSKMSNEDVNITEENTACVADSNGEFNIYCCAACDVGEKAKASIDGTINCK